MNFDGEHFPTYYELLGVTRTSTEDEIRSAYRHKVSSIHTDRGGDAEAHTNLTQAYNVLRNKKSKEDYDNVLEMYEVFCEECKGNGYVTRTRHFTQVIKLPCDDCKGTGICQKKSKPFITA